MEAERAFALDSSSAYAWFARGFANWTPLHKFPHAECIRDYKKSITIDPGFDEAHNQLGLVLSHVGLVNQSLEEFTRSIQLNSANDVARSNLVRTYFFDQQHQRVIEEFKRIPPSLYNVSYRLSQYANSLLHVGDYSGALAVIDKALEQKPNDFAMNAQKAIYYILNHQPQLAIPHLQIAEQGAVQPTGHFHHTSYDIATAYALLGQSDKALHWVNWSIENGFACYPAYSRDEFLTNLKSNSGFQKIIEDLHHTQVQMTEVLEEE